MADAMNPVNWFEIPVSDLDRAKNFYESVLGVELSNNDMGPMKMSWFPMEQGAPGATGSLVLMDGYTPSQSGTVVYLHVNDIDGTLAKINDNGGKMLTSKTSIGEYGSIAHFEDTEGNRVALHSDK